jgi:hypothetical protein
MGAHEQDMADLRAQNRATWERLSPRVTATRDAPPTREHDQ